MPTAEPDTAATTGLSDWAMARAANPPESRSTPVMSPAVVANSSLSPSEPLNAASRSAPAQKWPPLPVTTTTRTSSSASDAANACAMSSAICFVNVLRFSGRLNRTVATWSTTS